MMNAHNKEKMSVKEEKLMELRGLGNRNADEGNGASKF